MQNAAGFQHSPKTKSIVCLAISSGLEITYIFFEKADEFEKGETLWNNH